MATNKENITIITAKASHVLVSPRKTNLILKAIVGRPALLAIKQLSVIQKRASDPIAKLIKQGIGNAVSQKQVSPDSLIIDSAFATKGRTIKRAHIGGRGRTKPYERISSHLTLNLRVTAPKVVAPKAEVKKATEVKKTKQAVTKKTK
ncbi:MAG TPA: uL22 family ribosomal protein [Candidatus Woesebacteria bacterium]|nr:uL22 family ribosomal protein [Candidatus Woesebacteria bacterium]